MKKKLLLFAIPILLLPYFALFALATIFFSTKLTFFRLIMESVFHSNALLLIAALMIYCLVAIAVSVVCLVMGIRKKWDALLMAKTAMIVKLAQVPAYIVIFILGVMLAITIITIPFAIMLFFVDCLSLVLTGLLVIASVIITIRQGVLKPKDVRWVTLLQFVFCADVVASVVFYLKLRNRLKTDIL